MKQSLPSRERGLKFFNALLIPVNTSVAPFAGAWIEINVIKNHWQPNMSLPSRERGLKCKLMHNIKPPLPVAPFAGAWIEITNKDNGKGYFSRSLRGSVD